MDRNAIDMAYIAGIMDGDGSFSIIKLKTDASPLYYPFLQLGNRSLEVIEFLKETFGGSSLTGGRHICKDGSVGGIVYRWRLRSGHNVRPVLERLIPYLMIKKERASLLLEFVNSFSFERGKILTQEKIEERERYYIKMISYNDWTSVHESITTKLATKMSSDELFWSYVAGIMDTDGSFSIKRQVQNKGTCVRNPRYLPVISLSMSDTRAINFIRQNCYVGKLYIPRNSACSKGLHYQFGIYTKNECVEFLNRVIPFLRSKKENAKILLDFCLKSQNTKYCKAGISAEELAFREGKYQQLINANKYGVSKSSLMDLKPLPSDVEGNKAEGESHRERSKREDLATGCGTLSTTEM